MASSATGSWSSAPNRAVPRQPEYVLTDKGRDLAPAIIALTAWGDKWAAPEGPPVIFRHQACGGEITQQTACRGCGELVPAQSSRHTTGSRGPGRK